MIKIKQAIIVEGKYDKIRLSAVADAVIIPTNGFEIYKDEEKQRLIRTLAEKNGIIILTDSDSAGFRIRSHLRNIVKKGEVINVYIPDIFGKERRKREPSRQGKLGVEGMSEEILLAAFDRAGVTAEVSPKKGEPITKADLMDHGLIGRENSALRRAELQRRLGLPELLSANMLIEILNVMYSRGELIKILGEK